MKINRGRCGESDGEIEGDNERGRVGDGEREMWRK